MKVSGVFTSLSTGVTDGEGNAHPDLLPEIPGSAVLFLILEPFLHSAAAIILVVPVVMPQVNRVGIDPVHFGLIVTINLGTDPQTPPLASMLLACCPIAKAGLWEVTTSTSASSPCCSPY